MQKVSLPYRFSRRTLAETDAISSNFAGKADGTDPLSATSTAEASKSKGSLSFSSSTGKANGKTGAGPSETWEDVVKRSKSEADKKQQEKEQKDLDAVKQKEKDVKKKKKDKKEAKKKIGMLSFEED